jgi:ribosomal protein L32
MSKYQKVEISNIFISNPFLGTYMQKLYSHNVKLFKMSKDQKCQNIKKSKSQIFLFQIHFSEPICKSSTAIMSKCLKSQKIKNVKISKYQKVEISNIFISNPFLGTYMQKLYSHNVKMSKISKDQKCQNIKISKSRNLKYFYFKFISRNLYAKALQP